MLSVFCSPSRYTQGRNATASLGQEIVNLGLEGPALIVAGKSAIALLSEVWESSLHTAGLMHSILRFGGECSLLEIEKDVTSTPTRFADHGTLDSWPQDLIDPGSC